MKAILLILILVAAGRAGAASYDPAQAGREGVVLVANRNVPAGVELARYYARQRGVPEDRLFLLDLPDREDISRSDFEKRLRDPLLAHLREQGLIEQVRRQPEHVGEHESGWNTVRSKLRYLVLFYGVPLRIEDTLPWPLQKVANLVNSGINRDGASVEADLCLILHDSFDLRGRRPNPHYNQLRWENPAQGANLVLVGRLDGPDPLHVRAMIDQALRAETYGLQGRAYIDLRAPHDDDYLVGDYWFEEAGQRLTREGYEVVFERTDAVFGDRYPMVQAAFYLGWYTEKVTGALARTDFIFQPGALAYHNHSGNARTLRTAREAWCGPLLARGATLTLGAVNEPFLHYTPHVNILVDRLCNGAPAADAVYLSLAALSWQATLVGDPLYRPFAVPLDEQIRRLEAARDPAVDWAYVRKANLQVREGRLNLALRYLRDRLRVRESVILREKLADLYAVNDLYDEAARSYEQALAMAPDAESAVRLSLRYFSMLQVLGRTEERMKAEEQVRQRWAGSPFLDILSVAVP